MLPLFGHQHPFCSCCSQGLGEVYLVLLCMGSVLSSLVFQADLIAARSANKLRAAQCKPSWRRKQALQERYLLAI